MKRLLLLMLIIPLIGKSQDKGIHFEQGLSWEQLKEKAKAENKYIFVDCFATWCGPCKEMDKDVYPSQQIGAFMNDKFIAVKAQMDIAKDDNDEVKKWYVDAKKIQQQFKVTAFPSFLYFSPDGEILHRAIGYRTIDEFLSLAKSALNPKEQYYTLLKNYEQGKMDYKQLPYLIKISKDIGNDNMANRIASDYKTNYLDQANDSIAFTKENFKFLTTFPKLMNSKDRFFNFLFYNREKADKLMDWKGGSLQITDYVIYQEEIHKRIYKDDKPDNKRPNWKALNYNIRKKYGNHCADRIVLNAQLVWYEQKKDWHEVAKYDVIKIDKYGLDTAGLNWVATNNMIFEVIFTYINDKEILNKALKWMTVINEAHPDNPGDFDTYANLLYKVGRKREALSWEEKAMKLDQEQSTKANRVPDNNFKQTLEKMKMNEPTWFVAR